MRLGDLGRLGTLNRVGIAHGAPVALDFGAGSLKVLQVAAGEPPTLIAAARLDTPDELLGDQSRTLAFQFDALPALIRSLPLRGRRAVSAIPASFTYCKHLQLARSELPSAPALMRQALAAQVGCHESALVFRHHEVGPVARTGRTEVIGFAVPRDTVERLMHAIRSAKLAPVGAHTEYVAALAAFNSITRRESDEALTSLYIDLGAGRTKIMIAHGRRLALARKVDVGGLHLDQAIARHTGGGLSRARADRPVVDQALFDALAGAPDDEEPVPVGAESDAEKDAAGRARPGSWLSRRLAARRPEDRRRGAPVPGLSAPVTDAQTQPLSRHHIDLGEHLEIITDEVAMCQRYHEGTFPDRRIDRAVFLGGEASYLGLCQHIARKLRLRAQIADPLAQIARTGREPAAGVDLTLRQPGWAVAVGLCLAPTDL